MNPVIKVKSSDGKGMVYTTRPYQNDSGSELCKQCKLADDCRILKDLNRRCDILEVEVKITSCGIFESKPDNDLKVIFPDL